MPLPNKARGADGHAALDEVPVNTREPRVINPFSAITGRNIFHPSINNNNMVSVQNILEPR